MNEYYEDTLQIALARQERNITTEARLKEQLRICSVHLCVNKPKLRKFKIEWADNGMVEAVFCDTTDTYKCPVTKERVVEVWRGKTNGVKANFALLKRNGADALTTCKAFEFNAKTGKVTKAYDREQGDYVTA